MNNTRGETTQREQWTGQYGFIVAAVGSAIGLGNIWRFPGVAYTNGGGAFLVPYIVALLTAGIPILLLDYSLGHRYRGSAPAVFRRIGKKFEVLGWFQVAISLVIMTYYAVILAWAVRYISFSVTEAWGDDAATFFTADFLQVSEPGFNLDVVIGMLWPLALIWGLAGIVMSLSMGKGLEKANRIFVPLLLVTFLSLVVRALFLEGAVDGINEFFTPQWDALADPAVWAAAYSQIFFSVSVAFGIMLTYSSYLKRRSNLTSTALVTGFANSSFEILAGIGVFATLGFMAFSQGVSVGELEGISGPILSFVTFPTVISMMPGGPIFGVLFFTSLAMAGFTSLISLLQVVSAAVQEKFGLRRRTASVAVVAVTGFMSIALFSTTNGLNALDVVDKYINEIGIVSAAVGATVLLTLIVRKLPVLRAHLNRYSQPSVGRWWYVVVGGVTPAILSTILVATIRTLVAEGYDSYPDSFLAQYGWLMMAGVILTAIILTRLSWRTDVDGYDASTFHGDRLEVADPQLTGDGEVKK